MSALDPTQDRTEVAGVAAPSQLRVEIVRDRERFDELEDAWNDLFRRANRPQCVFQSFNWLWRWANHYLDGGTRLAIVTTWRGPQLEMVWPLVIRGRWPFRRLCWMGEPVGQYGDILIEDKPGYRDLLREGWETVQRLGADMAHLRKVRDDSMASRILYISGLSIAARERAPFLALASARDFPSYEKRYSSKVRSSRRRYQRRLEQTGAVTVETHREGPRGRELVRVALDLKKNWVRRRAVIAPALMDPRFRAFFEDAASGRERPSPLRAVAVKCGEKVVGVEISLICGDRLFGRVFSCDVDYEKRGAGSVLTEAAVRTAHEAGFEIYDLMCPEDAHKSEWADGVVGVRDWAAPLSSLGALYARPWICHLRPRIKHSLDHAPRLIGRLYAIGSGLFRLRRAARAGQN